jgi:pimeloyl-ACP methyl ester carboxylesterase
MTKISGLILGMLCLTVEAGAQSDIGAPPGQMIDVGGRKLHLLCAGSGTPTVILEAGASAFAIDWTLVQRDIARTNRVCSYDRAGMGWSGGVMGDADSETGDLHKLLSAAGERPPYVLVGASRGGMLIRSFLLDKPSEVVGLVFVDPATEDRMWVMVNGEALLFATLTPQQLQSTLPRQPVRIPRRSPQMGAPFDKLPPELYRVRIKLDERLIGSMPESVGPEVVAAHQERERSFLGRLMTTRSAPHPLGDRPTVVLSRGDERSEGREGVHQALAQLSTNSRHSVIIGAGHEIHLFEPAAVILAINDVLQAVREKTPLSRR